MTESEKSMPYYLFLVHAHMYIHTCMDYQFFIVDGNTVLAESEKLRLVSLVKH